MLTIAELLRAVLLPAVIALVVGLLARWRKAWAPPLAIGVGFASGWIASRGMPSIPPPDGTDWLFWLAAAAAVLTAIVIALVDRPKSRAVVLSVACLVLAVGVTFGAVAWPLVRSGALTGGQVLGASAAVAAGAAVFAGVARIAVVRVGAVTLIGILAIVAGAAGVVVFSSNLRVVGVYGLSAAAAIGGSALALAGMKRPLKPFAPTATSLCGVALVAGVLSGGHYYPEPGVSWIQVAALLASPLLVLVGAALPTRKAWVRSMVAIIAVGVVAAAIAAPVAIKAKKAAEEDPYAAYK